MCVCVRPLPFIGNSEPLYFCASHFSSIFYSLSSSPLLFSLTRSLFLGHQNKVLSMLHHTLLKDWVAGWLGSRWDDMSCVWCYKETATARWLQTILSLFVFNLYLLTEGWQSPTHARIVCSYPQRSCPVQPISLTRGHLANPPEQRRSRAGQWMIAVEYSFVQFLHRECQIISLLLSQFPAAPSTQMTPHRQKETEGGLKEQRPHVAPHNSSVPPVVMNHGRRYKCSRGSERLTFERTYLQVALFQFISLFGSISALPSRASTSCEREARFVKLYVFLIIFLGRFPENCLIWR